MLNNPTIIFSGTSNRSLADSVCRYLNLDLGKAEISRFPDGEKHIQLVSDVRGVQIRED